MSGIISALTSDEINEITNVVTDAVQATAIYKVFPLMMSIALLWAVWSYYNGSEKKIMGIETKELMRLGLLTFFLLSYRPVMDTVDKLMNGIISSFDVESDMQFENMIKTQTVKTVKKTYPQMTNEQEADLFNRLTGNILSDKTEVANFIELNFRNTVDSTDSGDFDIMSSDAFDKAAAYLSELVSSVTKFSTNALTVILSGIDYGALWVVKVVMWMLIISFVLIIRAVGPLALCVAMVIPSQAKKWFLTYATAKMSILSMAIIEALMAGIAGYMNNNIELEASGLSGMGTAETSTALYVTIGMSVTGIVTYCMSFWFTSKYFGSEDAGAMMSKAAGAATAVMSTSMTKIAKAMKVAT